MDVQKEVEVLNGKLETARLSKAPKKRKKIDEDVVPVPREPKRARREASPPRCTQNPYVDVEDDSSFNEIGEIGDSTLEHGFQAVHSC